MSRARGHRIATKELLSAKTANDISIENRYALLPIILNHIKAMANNGCTNTVYIKVDVNMVMDKLIELGYTIKNNVDFPEGNFGDDKCVIIWGELK